MTELQQEIARSIALGGSVQAIARRLGVRPQSVRRQLTHLYDQTGTWSQAQLAGWCVAHGIVSVADLQKAYASPRDADTE